jgi:hypothetical protein
MPEGAALAAGDVVTIRVPEIGELINRALQCARGVNTMSKIDWSRVLLCGLLAGTVWIILGGTVTALLGHDFATLPDNHLGMPTPGFVAFNIVVDLLEGISILWLYAAIRPLYGPGTRTAIIAAFAWWSIVTLGDATWCSFGFFPPRTVIPLMIGTLPALILATFTGARFYREQSGKSGPG